MLYIFRNAFELFKMGYASADYLHTVIEAEKLAYADRDTFYADPKFSKLNFKSLLSREYAKDRAKLITARASMQFQPGSIDGKTLPHPTTETPDRPPAAGTLPNAGAYDPGLGGARTQQIGGPEESWGKVIAAAGLKAD